MSKCVHQQDVLPSRQPHASENLPLFPPCLQIAFADKILLNKIDLVSSEEKDVVISRIRGINKTVQIIECQQSRADLDQILGVKAFNLDK